MYFFCLLFNIFCQILTSVVNDKEEKSNCKSHKLCWDPESPKPNSSGRQRDWNGQHSHVCSGLASRTLDLSFFFFLSAESLPSTGEKKKRWAREMLENEATDELSCFIAEFKHAGEMDVSRRYGSCPFGVRAKVVTNWKSQHGGVPPGWIQAL